MRIHRSVAIDTDSRDYRRELRALGRLVWREIHMPTTDRRSAPDLMADLRRQYGGAPGITRALGETPGTRSYKNTLRQVERHLKGGEAGRGIGASYRAAYSQISPSFAFRAPREGALHFEIEGEITIPSGSGEDASDDTRERTIYAPQGKGHAWEEPEDWEEVLQDPMTFFEDKWDGPRSFGAMGRFHIYFEGE